MEIINLRVSLGLSTVNNDGGHITCAGESTHDSAAFVHPVWRSPACTLTVLGYRCKENRDTAHLQVCESDTCEISWTMMHR